MHNNQNNQKKYASLSTLQTFLDNLKTTFSALSHKHKLSDLTDYKVDTSLSSTSTNPVQNKVLNEEFDAIATAMNALEAAIDTKSNASHNHDSRYYTQSQIDTKLSAKSDSTHNHDAKYDTKGSAAAVQTNLDEVSDTLKEHTDNTDIHVTTSNKSNWNSAYTHSTSAHARIDATKVEDSTTNGNIKINGTETNVYSHPNSGVTAGTYKSVTVNAQGHVTGGSNPTTLAGYGITDAESKGAASSALTSAKEYTDTVASSKADKTHNHDSDYDEKGAAAESLDSAKSYTDTKVANLASTSTVDTKISTHNTATTAHSDIRDLITGLTARLNTLANSDDTTLDQMSEVVAYIKNNKSLIDGITTSKVNVTDIVNNLTTNVTNKPLSAAQGVAIKALIDALQAELDSHGHAISDVTNLQSTLNGKASQTSLDTHTSNTTVHTNATERTNWNAAYTHSTSAHAPINAEKNQNAFSNIKVGYTTISADTTTDTLTLVGSNVTITPDATNDKVTIAVASGSTSTKGIVQLTNSTSSTSTTTAATPNSVKSAYDLANTAKTNAATAQSKADSAYTLAESKVDSLSDLGITATATELNYMDGVTSSVQTQLDNKVAKSNPSGTGSLSLNRKASTTIGNYSVAEGYNTTASGKYSHAEGNETIASGESSHSEGGSTVTKGQYSHAEGFGTLASSNHQHVQGKYNVEDTTNTYAHIVGNGSASKRSNAHTLDWDGNAWFAGNVYVGGSSQSEATPLTSVPACSTSNNGQFLRVVNGVATWSTVSNAEEATF